MDAFATRIYVQLLPDKATTDYLTHLRDQLAPFVQGRAVDQDRWHVTILHFGIAEHVFHDIRRDYPALSKPAFNAALSSYIEQSKKNLPESMALTTESFELFGINENVLVLKLTPSDEIIAAHDQALTSLVTFLDNCGVKDTENFMKGSINFRWALDVKPHITLYRAVRNSQLSKVALEPVELSFLPGDLHGVNGR